MHYGFESNYESLYNAIVSALIQILIFFPPQNEDGEVLIASKRFSFNGLSQLRGFYYDYSFAKFSRVKKNHETSLPTRFKMNET